MNTLFVLQNTEGLMTEIRTLQRQVQEIQKQQLTQNVGSVFERQEGAGAVNRTFPLQRP